MREGGEGGEEGGTRKKVVGVVGEASDLSLIGSRVWEKSRKQETKMEKRFMLLMGF